MNFFLVVLISVIIAVYVYTIFHLASNIDRYLYEKDINVTLNMAYKYSLIILMWPFTCWFNKLWEFEK